MKKRFVLLVPTLLAGCSYYHNFLEHMDTDTMNYQCDEKPLTVKINAQQHEASMVLDNQPRILTRGISASGERYTDGIYVFWAQEDSAMVYKRDTAILNNCRLAAARR